MDIDNQLNNKDDAKGLGLIKSQCNKEYNKMLTYTPSSTRFEDKMEVNKAKRL